MRDMRFKWHAHIVTFLIFSRFFMSVQLCRAHHHHQQINSKQQKSEASKDSDDDHHDMKNNILHIGLIVDMQSSVGKIVLSCIKIAIEDNNALYRQNGFRFVLEPRDSKGEPLNAMMSAKDLIERVKVKAIIVPEMTSEASMMATLGDKANVPILTFSSIQILSTPHPYFLQISEDENVQFKGIIAVLEKFKWENIVLIHEDTDDGKNSIPQLFEEFQEKNIRVFYKNALSFSIDGDELMEEFDKLKMMGTSIFVVHASPSLASKVFINSKKFGMMSEGHVWLITDKTMNFFGSLDPFVIDSMKGALGLKSCIPDSSQLRNFTTRWRNEVQPIEPDQRDVNILGLRAYDTISALARATVRRADSFDGSQIASEITKSKFKGLGGDFQLVNGKLVTEGYEVVNVIGQQGNRVGYWTMTNGLIKNISLVNNNNNTGLVSHNLGLETVFWPGLTMNAPKGFLFPAGGTRLKIVYPTYGLQECISEQHDKQNNVTIVVGFCKDVFDAALKISGVEVPYDLVPFVDPPSHEIYDHLVSQVYFKNYDAIIGDVTITYNRSLYVDFTMPFTDLGVGIVARLESNNRWFFLKPLDWNMWITVVCFFILLAIIVWLLEHRINEEFQGSLPQQIVTALWFSISTLVYAHREQLQSNLSKFVVGIWLFVMFILASSYTAILSSILTVQQIQLASGYINVGHLLGSFAGGEIRNNTNFDGNVIIKSLDSFDKFNDALAKGGENGGIDAFIDEMPYAKVLLAKYPSDKTMIETSSTTSGFGFVFQKGSPLVPAMSRAIAKLRADKTLLEMENKWLYNNNNNNNKGEKESSSSISTQDSQQGYQQFQPRPLSLNNFLGLFLVSGLSKIIALLFVIIFSLREKLSLNHQFFCVFSQAKLAHFIKYLFPKNPYPIHDALPR